ncbi:unnamed protein product [Lymnaea stagnalis]|uniref:Uncharacterized protein n=1 Tax=Lymnaea stagnalis TaxID=6523 RepID=A0AAV2I3S5_LYMST
MVFLLIQCTTFCFIIPSSELYIDHYTTMTNFTLTLAGTLLLVLSAGARPQGDGAIKRQGEDPGEPEDVDVVRTIVTRATVTTAGPNVTTSSAPSNPEATTNTSGNQGATDKPNDMTTAVVNQDTASLTSADQPTTAPVASQGAASAPPNQETTADPATTAPSVNATAVSEVSDIPTTASVSVAADRTTQVPLRR